MSAVAVRTQTLFDLSGESEVRLRPVERVGRRSGEDAAAKRAAAAAARTIGVGGEPSLDTAVSGMWEGLAAHQTVACPLCDGAMTPVYGAHARALGGRCQSCGTTLS